MYVKLDGATVVDVKLRIYEPPRFFEALLRGRAFTEAPDITARICGICPVAYQMSAVRAMEDACGVQHRRWSDPRPAPPALLRRVDREPQPARLHAARPGLPRLRRARWRWPRDHREIVEQGLQMKKAGNAVMATGRRAGDPPDQRPRRRLLPCPHRGRAAQRSSTRWSARARRRSRPSAGRRRCRFPRSNASPSCSRCRTPAPTRSIAGGSLRPRPGHLPSGVRRARRRGARRALERAARSRPRARHISDRPARALCPLLGSAVAAGRGPRRSEAGLETVCRNPFRSIVVRAVELVQACDEALAVIDGYEEPDAPAVEVERDARSATARPRPRAACSTTATRSTTTARSSTPGSCPPPRRTSSRSRRICGPWSKRYLDLPDEQLALRCEQAIRNHDPCISCATHFLELTVDRGAESA